MVAFPRFQGLTGSIPTIGGVLAGAGVALAVALMPGGTLESLVWTSGITALIPAAEPPLGTTARAVLALAGGGGAAAIVWSALYLLFGPGGYLNRAVATEAGRPNVRRADAHPDAPPRRPMSAADLGTPLMEVVAVPEPAPEPPAKPSVMAAVLPVERALPADLDTPLSSFDPAAIPDTTARPIAPTVALAPGERMDAFELTPVIRFGQPDTLPERQPTIATASLDQLIRRLEQGAQRRTAHG